MTKKIISWNVNGFRAIIKKGLEQFVDVEQPDIICFNELKMNEKVSDDLFQQYYKSYSFAEKKGYSGVAIFSKEKPIRIIEQYKDFAFDEGRVLINEFNCFYLIVTYVPNSQEELKRLAYKVEFMQKLKALLESLNVDKPVIVCGDFNIAHEPIDLKKPEENHFTPGYSDEERHMMDEVLINFVDCFRYFYPNKIEYSWWSYLRNARSRNDGWRIDYFIVSKSLIKYVKDCQILTEIMGSDHAPIKLLIDLN